MKRVVTLPAVLTLMALLFPCTHGGHHHHPEPAAHTACAEAHPCCSSCLEDPCLDSPEASLPGVAQQAGSPPAAFTMTARVQARCISAPPIILPSGMLSALRTIHLLI